MSTTFSLPPQALKVSDTWPLQTCEGKSSALLASVGAAGRLALVSLLHCPGPSGPEALSSRSVPRGMKLCPAVQEEAVAKFHGTFRGCPLLHSPARATASTRVPCLGYYC